MNIKNRIRRQPDNLAFLIGNGINYFPNNYRERSWENLLKGMYSWYTNEEAKEVPDGLSYTEYYDLLALENPDDNKVNTALHKYVCEAISQWKLLDHYGALVDSAKSYEIPILTTNYDLLLPKSRELKLHRIGGLGFTDYYPWSSYYGDEVLSDPIGGFGIWYVHGLVTYPRSIRLGLSEYMGCVEKARAYMHKGNRLFRKENRESWGGRNTWLHIFFTKSLCIFGLKLAQNEVFLRWLLIERARYFRKYPEFRRDAWYYGTEDEQSQKEHAGKIAFLNAVGVKFVSVGSYKDLYETPWK